MSSLLKLKPEELKRHSKTFGGKDLVEAIIVVHAATDPMAENLFQAIREAAMPNEAGKRRKCRLFTKFNSQAIMVRLTR